MSYCQKCGTENDGNASFCQNCGTQIKPKENKTGISKLINWKAIIIGAFVFFALFVLIIIISGGITVLWVPLLALVMFITGIITAFISGKEYSTGIINSLIIAFFYSIIFGLTSGLNALIGGLVVFVVFGVIGSLIGVLIYRKHNNFNLTS